MCAIKPKIEARICLYEGMVQLIRCMISNVHESGKSHAKPAWILEMVTKWVGCRLENGKVFPTSSQQ
jgi:hypothetical protein